MFDFMWSVAAVCWHEGKQTLVEQLQHSVREILFHKLLLMHAVDGNQERMNEKNTLSWL